MKQETDQIRNLAVKLYEAGQKQKRKQFFNIWGLDAKRKHYDLPSEMVAVWDAVALAAIQALKTSDTDAAKSRLYQDALKHIASARSVEQVKKRSAKFGLDEQEALEMAVEELINEAKSSLSISRRIKPASNYEHQTK